MVKMMRPPYAYSPAGEPDAWFRSDTYLSGRSYASDPKAQLDGGRSLRRQAEARTRPTSTASRPLRTTRPAEECGVADFRSLARTIERRRQLEPLARSADPRAATVRPKPRASSQSWIDDVRLSAEPAFPQRAAPSPRPVERAREERAVSIDASEIARLEGVLQDVLDRLRALEQQASTPQARPGKSGPSAVEARARRREADARREAVSERPRVAASRPAPDARPRTEEVVSNRPRRLWR